MLLALLPGDPLAAAARRAQDQIASSGWLQAQALPPLIPLALANVALEPAAQRRALTIVVDCVSSALLTVRAQPVRRDGAVLLELEHTQQIAAAARRVADEMPSLAQAFGSSRLASQLLPRSPGAAAILLVPAARVSSPAARRSPERPPPSSTVHRLARLASNECRSGRWHAAVVAVSFRQDGSSGVISWIWELIAARKLRKRAPQIY